MNQSIVSPDYVIEKYGEFQISSEIDTFDKAPVTTKPVETAVELKEESFTHEDIEDELIEEASVAESTDFTESTDAAFSTDCAVEGERTQPGERVNLDDLRRPRKPVSLLSKDGEDEELETSVVGLIYEEAPVSHAKIQWEKPDWVKEKKLKSHEKSETLKTSGDLQAPITKIGETSKFKWEKPDWAKEKNLKAHERSEVMKEKGDLQAPITKATVERSDLDYLNFEANPMRLRTTEKGSAVRMGEDLAKAITHIERDPMADINLEAAPSFVLRESETGNKIKSGLDLAAPVTFPRKETCDANFDANPALLKPTAHGAVLKSGKEISRPITFPNGKDDE